MKCRFKFEDKILEIDKEKLLEYFDDCRELPYLKGTRIKFTKILYKAHLNRYKVIDSIDREFFIPMEYFTEVK